MKGSGYWAPGMEVFQYFNTWLWLQTVPAQYQSAWQKLILPLTMAILIIAH